MTNTLCHPGHPFVIPSVFFVIPSVFFVIPSEVEGSVLFPLQISPLTLFGRNDREGPVSRNDNSSIFSFEPNKYNFASKAQSFDSKHAHWHILCR